MDGEDDGAIVINQIIYLKKAGHKKIVIGKNGSMIKMLGKAARIEIEQILERSVHLFLFVKVRENGWMILIDIKSGGSIQMHKQND